METTGGHRAKLERRDFIVFERRLKEALAGLFSFQGHGLIFPRAGTEPVATWNGKEKKILLPLPDSSGGPAAIFTARGVAAAEVKPLLPMWPALAAILTENLLLYKQSLCDPATGLFTRHHLLAALERELELMREPAPALPGKAEAADPEAGGGLFAGGGELPRRGSLGMVVFRLAALRDVVREYGYAFADSLTVALADALSACRPEQAVAARTGDSEFAVYLPTATAKSCRTLATAVNAAFAEVALEHPLKRERIGVGSSAGYALYPQDMAGDLFALPYAEQARLLLRKARLAAALAAENHALGIGRDGPVMGFGRILAEGGRVQEVLPLSRVVVGLGGGMHAREGARFSIWSVQYPVRGAENRPPSALTPLYKGELVLLEVGENTSQAEVTHLGDPAWPIEPGDRLTLLPEDETGPLPVKAGEERRDPISGFLRHGDFFARWAEEREHVDGFSLVLVRLVPLENPAVEESGEATPNPDRCMAEAAAMFRDTFGRNILAGRYGLNSLIFFHPGREAEGLAARYEALLTEMRGRLGVEVAAGIAPYPCLEFRKSDAPENCRKALDYALLLPEPHVGVLDSLALNISADKLYSQGDTFGAVREYQLALLADAANGMAWNSLGICLAGLGRHAEAESRFREALACDPTDVMALYNLGYVHQITGRADEARAFFETCLTHSPGHLFALIRLGQLAEGRGEASEAETLYERAAALPGGKGPTCRHFARLRKAEGRRDEARELLHEALVHDPQDALAQHLLAGLYLDAGEDPEMAAALARQSVSLRPDLKPAWLELARALEAQGKAVQAREARLKAGEL